MKTTVTLSTFALACLASINCQAETGRDTRVVVASEPYAGLLSPKKEKCDLLFVNADGSAAIRPASVAAAPRKAVENPLDPPFSCDFTGDSDMDLFTIIDANRDGNVWERNAQGFAALMYNSWQASNDYIVSPGLNLKKGFVYTFSAAARPYRSQYPEKIEMWAGTAATAEGLDQCLLPAVTLTEEAWNDVESFFVAPEDGVYYFAVRGVSDADCYALLINDFRVSAGISGDSPALPGIDAVRNADGVPEATITATASAFSFNGAPLTELTALRIYRDNELIKTFENPVPGQSYTYTDDNPSVAMHTYSAECENAAGTGPKASASCFTGIYYAVWPETVTPSIGENEGQVVLDWTPCLTDQMGNPLRPDQVTYTIYRIHNSQVALHAKDVTEPHFVDQVCGADEPQREVQYTIMSNTSYGQSAGTGSGVYYAGAPYELPYTESFANGGIGSLLFTRGLANYAASWEIANMDDYDLPYPGNGSDNDNGFVYHRAYNGGEQAMIGTAKIHIPAEANSAKLEFDTYLNGSDETPNQNILEVSVNDNTELTKLGEAPQHGTPGWKTVEYDLTPYKGKTVQIHWKNTVNTHVLTTLDNIRVSAESPEVGVIEIEGAENAEAEYFTLQGIRVNGTPAAGIYLCRRGDKVEKVVVR